jgi:hypothetical protein
VKQFMSCFNTTSRFCCALKNALGSLPSSGRREPGVRYTSCSETATTACFGIVTVAVSPDTCAARDIKRTSSGFSNVLGRVHILVGQDRRASFTEARAARDPNPRDKRRLIYPGGHSVPRTEMIKESLLWLDRYFGPVTSAGS